MIDFSKSALKFLMFLFNCHKMRKKEETLATNAKKQDFVSWSKYSTPERGFYPLCYSLIKCAGKMVILLLVEFDFVLRNLCYSSMPYNL